MFAQETITTPSTVAALSEAEKIRQISQRDDFLLYSVILAGMLLVAAVAFYFTDRWRKSRPSQEGDREASLTLSSFREMYEDGEITESEYRKLRDKMAAKMKGNTTAKPIPAPSPPPAPPLNSDPSGKPPDPAN
jgi:hypothetical protein